MLYLLVLVLATAAPAPAAEAHSSGGELVQVGREDTIVLSVNAETPADMVGVDVVLPPGFSPDRQRPAEVKGGGVGGVFITWQAQYAGSEIHAGGAPIANGGVLLITFSGTASQVGTLSFVTVTHAADGVTVRWDGPSTSAHPAALVFVVASLSRSPQALVPGASATPPASHPPWWAVAVAGVGGLALIGCLVTARRRRSS